MTSRATTRPVSIAPTRLSTDERHAQWEEALSDYLLKRSRAETMSNDADDADTLVEAWGAAQDHLIIDVPAPDIGAVLAKADLAVERCEGFGYIDTLWDAIRADLCRLARASDEALVGVEGAR